MAVQKKKLYVTCPSTVLNNPTKFYCKYRLLFLKVILRKAISAQRWMSMPYSSCRLQGPSWPKNSSKFLF